MNAHPSCYAAPAAAEVDGQRRGERVVRRLADGMSLHPDDLLHDVLDALADDGVIVAATPRLRGLLRAVAKAIESGGAR